LFQALNRISTKPPASSRRRDHYPNSALAYFGFTQKR
jgi:hypothetical protein